jgi:GH24 family phage-related lysozyme (muramidase)
MNCFFIPKAEEVLKSDLEPYEECVEHYVPALNDDQFSALVSFAWTISCGSLRTSILLHYIKAQSFMDASNEFYKFAVSRNGKNLTLTRQLEKELFCKNGGCNS